jgi:hypothetical protein
MTTVQRLRQQNVTEASSRRKLLVSDAMLNSEAFSETWLWMSAVVYCADRLGEPCND